MQYTRVGAGEAISALFEGMSRGFEEPALRKKLIISLIINAIAFTLLVTLLIWGVFAGLDWLLGDAGDAEGASWLVRAWYWVAGALVWILRAAAVVGALFLAPVLFHVVASILLPAFHGPVFLEARRSAGGPASAGAEQRLVAVLAVELRRLARLIVLSLLLLLLNLVPVIGSVAYLVAQFLLAARTLGWDLLSYHFELHGLDYEQQKAFLRRERGMVLALGGVATLLCLIPIAQIVFLTTNVAGAGVLSAWMDGAPRSGR